MQLHVTKMQFEVQLSAHISYTNLLVIIVVPLVTEMNTPERSYKIYKFTLTISKLPVETKHNRATGDGLFL